MDIRRLRQDGGVALVLALGILVGTAILSLWRMHKEEKVHDQDMSERWNKCVENCMEDK